MSVIDVTLRNDTQYKIGTPESGSEEYIGFYTTGNVAQSQHTIRWNIANGLCKIDKIEMTFRGYSATEVGIYINGSYRYPLIYTGHEGKSVTLKLSENGWVPISGDSGEIIIKYTKRSSSSGISYVQNAQIIFYTTPTVTTKPQTISVPQILLSDNNAIGNPQIVYITNEDVGATHDVVWQYYDQNSQVIKTSPTVSCAASERSPGYALDNTESTNYGVNTVLRGNKTSKVINGLVTVTTYAQATGAALSPVTTQNCVINIPPTMGPAFQQTWWNNMVVERDAIAQQAYPDVMYLQNHCWVKFSIHALSRRFAYLQKVVVSTDSGQSKEYTIPNSEIPDDEETIYDITAPGDSLKIAVDKSGTFSIYVRVIDSRGFYVDNTLVLPDTVEACDAPVFTSASIVRCNFDGTENEDGKYALVRATETHFGDSASLQATLYAGNQPIGSAATMINGQVVLGNGQLSTEQSYRAVIVATDGLGQSSSITVNLGSALYTIHRLVGGQGIAFGKAADLFGVEINKDWPLYAHGKEIQKLILDIAYPPGSIMETFDESFDPNVNWPWSLWGKLDNITPPYLAVNVWVRQR